MSETENWLPVEGFPNTEISSMGRIRSLFRGSMKIRCPFQNEHGYLIIKLQNKARLKHFRVHRLVADAFIGAIPEGMDINHKDGNKQNNSVENLEFATRSENCKHAFQIGLSYTPFRERGEKHCRSLLKDSDVIALREAHSKGESRRSLAERYSISYYTVCDIVTRRRWTHI